MEHIQELVNQWLVNGDELVDIFCKILEIIGGSAVLGKLLPSKIKNLDTTKAGLIMANLKNLVNVGFMIYNLVIQMINAVGLNNQKKEEAKPNDN